MKEITVEQLVAEVRKVAASNPTFVYSKDGGRCNYQDKTEKEPKGACIIGQALANLGVSNEDRKAWDYRDEAGILSLFQHREDYSDFSVTGDEYSDEVSWLGEVQSSQDHGSSWGQAIRAADESYPSVV